MLGSVARGDDGPGSDLELWVLSDRDQVVRLWRGGIPVTLMYETLERAFDPEHWLRVEVGHARVLVDRGGVFARLKRAFARAQPGIRAAIVRATKREQAAAMRRSRRGRSSARLLALREATIRAACLPVYLKHGMRDPRWRHLVAFYPPAAVELLRTVLGLERRPPALARLVRSRPSALAKLRAGAWEEAVLNARFHDGHGRVAALQGGDLRRARLALTALLPWTRLPAPAPPRGRRRRR